MACPADPPGCVGGDAGRTAAAGGVTRLPLAGRRLKSSSPEATEAGAWTMPCFVAGPENRLVAAVFQRLLAAVGDDNGLAVGQSSIGSLLLFGPSGCGKTHLARGLAEAWHNRLGHTKNGDSQVAYLTASDFRRQVASAVNDRSLDAFRRQIRRCRLLVIDDLPRLAGEAYALEELIHTVDALAVSGALFVGASQKPLADVPQLSRALTGRLLSGVTLQVAQPSLATRQALLQQALSALGCTATPKALALLAEQAPTDPRRLLGVALRLRRRLRAGATLDEKLAASLAELDLARPSPPAGEIVATVARYYGLPKAKLTSSSRQKSIVLARAVAIYLTRELTPLSYDQIGKLLGGRDHTTVLHNYRRIERSLPTDRALRTALDELRGSITAAAAV
ncbi:helix-turn-helix domain-containing protein [Posidoniimonas corsicana]|uniref:helix-turn-helix domain-containing protein n=1 Tax=Posidoniimonas corsicana TaxID=1938618 RepID=UPI0018D3A9CB|nr:DnaA/Hda family protein [Posidoniimonas corsicana]